MLPYVGHLFLTQEIGFTHMRILEGVGTLIQLGGLVARLCKMVNTTMFVPVNYFTHDLS